MNSSTIISARPDFQKISRDRWIQFLDDFTRENRGAHARVEIIGANAEIGYQVETGNRPFDGVSADIKTGESTVWITLGSTMEDHITHGVHQATAIHSSSATENRGAMLEVEDAEDSKTILELTQPGAYALPPVKPRESVS